MEKCKCGKWMKRVHAILKPRGGKKVEMICKTCNKVELKRGK